MAILRCNLSLAPTRVTCFPVHGRDAPIVPEAIAGVRPGVRVGHASRPDTVAVFVMGWLSNAQAQSLTIDPETIVPLPDSFEMERRRPTCRPRWPASRARGSGPG